MAKLNLNKYKKDLKKISWKRIVGIVFLVACLITAVVITNDTARQFLFNSFADNGCKSRINCAACGSPRERQTCRNEVEDNEKALIKKLKDQGGTLTQRQLELLGENGSSSRRNTVWERLQRWLDNKGR